MKLYLAGSMSGYPEHNFPEFHRRAAMLRAEGHEVVNPADLNLDCDRTLSPDDLWRECMRKDIKALIECEGIALMPGWRNSRGANLEYHIALGLRLAVVHLPEALNEPV